MIILANFKRDEHDRMLCLKMKFISVKSIRQIKFKKKNPLELGQRVHMVPFNNKKFLLI